MYTDTKPITFSFDRMRLMIAAGPQSRWAPRLAEVLAPWQVDVQWSRSDHEALEVFARDCVHIGVVDHNLPATSGLELVRRLRHMGFTVPCVLVCEGATQRLLSDAIALDVFSVVQADEQHDVIAPYVVRLAQQKYRFNWTLPVH